MSVVDGWMGATVIPGGPIAVAPNGPFAAGTTPIYTGRIVDAYGQPIAAATLLTLTLSLVDTLTGLVVNGVSAINVLNTGRGTVDAVGNVTIALLPGDTAVASGTKVQRSMILDWTTANLTGRHQVNFELVALAGL